MKRAIRRCVFETNSSSVHSITISKSSDYNLPKAIHFGFDRYGWEHDTYSDYGDKANYLWTAICVNMNCSDAFFIKDRITNMLNKHSIECIFDMWKDEWEYKGNMYPEISDRGYIDHADQAQEFIKDVLIDENKLLNYLFSDDSYIITGNDNDDDCDDDYFEGETDDSWCYVKGN